MAFQAELPTYIEFLTECFHVIEPHCDHVNFLDESKKMSSQKPNNTVPKLYHGVINEVIDSVRDSFLDEGIDEGRV